MAAEQMSDEIGFEVSGCAGIITLNRQHALNALTHDMVEALKGQLSVWERDDSIARVLIKAAPGRAFSAGGDIRDLYDKGLAQDASQINFFRDEYPLNAWIHGFSKPYIALVDGIAMGGGVGVSFNGRLRLGSENMRFAMPEVGIGFFPDVGATWILPRLPFYAGLYLGLTGQRIGQADAHALGLITHAVRAQDWLQIEQALCQPGNEEALLAPFIIEPSEEGAVTQMRKAIEQAFCCESPLEIIKALEQMSKSPDEVGDWAQQTITILRAKSPLSLSVAFEQLRRGAELSFNEAMQLEFRIVSRILKGHDFYEGVRATIIDKDNAPKWQPARLEEVTPAMIAAHFAPVPGGDLEISF